MQRRQGHLAWLLAGLALVVISLAVILWAGTRPGYDPYGWLVWGKLTVHWHLDTNGAPSWKPLPFLLTVPYALLGHLALWLWMETAVAVSLAGPVFAWRIALMLVDAPAERRWAGHLAGAIAAVALLGIRDYSHFILSAQSDTMIVTLCLAAVDCGLRGHRRWALWLWTAAALGRPEAWPFLAAHGLWWWRSEPRRRWEIAAAAALVLAMWFGIPALTAKSAFIAGDNALHSPRQLRSNKLLGTLDRFLDLHELAVWLAAVVGLALAAVRRVRAAMWLALGAVVWVAVEVAFVLHGYPGVPRYLFEPMAVVGVLAGAAAGWLALALPVAAGRILPALGSRAGTVATAALVAVFAVALVPAARSRVRIERADLHHERQRTHRLDNLRTLIDRLGYSRVVRCGEPDVPIAFQSIFAWYTGVRIGALYVNEGAQRRHPTPLVRFVTVGPSGWKVVPVHIPAAQRALCRPLAVSVGG